jgi:hypothetical protein
VASWVPSETTYEVLPDVKPEKRHKATRAEWEYIHQHFAGACCVACGMAYQHLHHIAFRKADSGDDVLENLAPMCLSCHERFHKRSQGWERVAAAIRQYVIVNNERRRYAEAALGERFNSRYPCLPNTDPQFRADFVAIYGQRESEAVEGHEAA